MVNFSIIIPVKAINDYVRETVHFIKDLEVDQWELIILPNELDKDEWQDKRIKLIPSGMVGPAEKRDLGASFALGKILVFLDDDSYPNSDILTIATPYFEDDEIVALGGPAVTPHNDSFWQKVSGAVFLSKFSGGNPERYVPVGIVKEVDDWPSVNLMVRTKEFKAVGGFNTKYWPGEDTKLCLQLKKYTKRKILYIPNMIVWHHRRSGLWKHIKQVGAYGLHRGYFFKAYPENSRKLMYIVPSMWLIFLIIFVLNLIIEYISNDIFIVGCIAYCIALIKAFIDIIKWENVPIGLAAIIYIFCTHMAYGFKFIQGLMTKNMKSKLR